MDVCIVFCYTIGEGWSGCNPCAAEFCLKEGVKVSEAEKKSSYTGYTESRGKSSMAYAKKNIKRVPLDMQQDYYNDVLIPAVEKSGLSVNGFIKAAIAEKIERLINA